MGVALHALQQLSTCHVCHRTGAGGPEQGECRDDPPRRAVLPPQLGLTTPLSLEQPHVLPSRIQLSPKPYYMPLLRLWRIPFTPRALPHTPP